MSLPTVAEIVSSAVFVEEVAPVVAPLTEETFIVGMVGLIERVSQDCCCIDVGVVVPELSPVVSARAAAVPMSLPPLLKCFPLPFLLGGGSLLMQPPWPM